MYAIIESGGKQYRVAEGEVVRLEKLSEEEGKTVSFDRVLLVKSDDDVMLGKPYLDKAKVEGSVTAHGRERKVVVFKKKRRKQYKRTRGHRQPYTDVRIGKIEL